MKVSEWIKLDKCSYSCRTDTPLDHLFGSLVQAPRPYAIYLSAVPSHCRTFNMCSKD